MSVGPASGVVGSAAGAPYAQTKGSEASRASQESSAQQRQLQNEKSAAETAGIGQTQEDKGASERDADGRRLWEAQEPDGETSANENEEESSQRHSIDPTGKAGGQLDLSG